MKLTPKSGKDKDLEKQDSFNSAAGKFKVPPMTCLQNSRRSVQMPSGALASLQLLGGKPSGAIAAPQRPYVRERKNSIQHGEETFKNSLKALADKKSFTAKKFVAEKAFGKPADESKLHEMEKLIAIKNLNSKRSLDLINEKFKSKLKIGAKSAANPSSDKGTSEIGDTPRKDTDLGKTPKMKMDQVT